jgi:hypothetical protein
MAFGKTITSANSVYMLTIPGIYSSPVKLEGFMADAAFANEALELAEIVVGVDGHVSGGFTPNTSDQTISLMPDSPSSDVFDNWIETSLQAREVFPAQAVIIIPSIRKKWNLFNGTLRRGPQIPTAGRVLQGRAFVITWEKIQGAPQ